MRKILFSSLIMTVMLLAIVLPAQAINSWPPTGVTPSDTVTFLGCSNNNPGDTAIGVAQFYVDVFPWGTNTPETQALFVFHNEGPDAVVISDVYFDDGALVDIATIFNTNAPGETVNFSKFATPPNLPSPNCVVPPFGALEGGSADADPAPPKNGVGPGEMLGIVFNLTAGHTFADVLNGLENGTLRIGIHAIAYASEGSESFVSGNSTAVALKSFAARGDRLGATLTWSTATEIDNAGFNLYRATSPSAFHKVNSGLVTAKGNFTSGSTYLFRDNVAPGTYYYMLEDISLTGKATRHAPVKVTVGLQFRRPLYRPVLPAW